MSPVDTGDVPGLSQSCDSSDVLIYTGHSSFRVIDPSVWSLLCITDSNFPCHVDQRGINDNQQHYARSASLVL